MTTPAERFATALRGFLADRTWAAVYDLPRALGEVAGVNPDRVRVTVTSDTLRLDIRSAGEAWADYAQARDAVEHDYLSTGCLHDQHDYCAAMTGQQGAKRPATCKFCDAQCRCTCHAKDAR